MIKFETKSFEALSLSELYDIMQLRQDVFIVEQDCPYLDADGKDQSSYHVLGTHDKQLVAYCRLVPPGVSYDEMSSIGRVATSIEVRKFGYGKLMMEYAIETIESQFPHVPIKISAQKYLNRFYTNLGFKAKGAEYLEDGIPHIAMTK